MITANELKNKGVSAIEHSLKNSTEVAITVRGSVKYVAMRVEHYDELKLAELEKDYHKALDDVKNGERSFETAKEHLARLWPKST